MNTVKEYGKFLNTFKWDYFATLTYRYNISQRKNRSIMTELTENLKAYGLAFNMFWVFEKGGMPHNHLLIKGNAIELIDNYWKGKGFRNDYQVFDSSKGASWYVCKYMNKEAVDYDLT